MYKKRILGVVALSILFTSCVNNSTARASGTTYGSSNTKDVKLDFSEPQTHKRVALVIGNNRYEESRQLTYPVDDARAMRDFLTSKRFKVFYADDADEKEMRSIIREFMGSIDRDSVAFFYYSGHGIQEKSQKHNGELTNYLIPVDDSKLKSIGDLDYNSISLNKILTKMDEKNSGLNIVLVDSCRSGFGKGWTKSSNNTLANISAKGVFIAYATSSGTTASDNALFRRSFIKNANRPLKLTDIFENVKMELYGTSQRPSTHNDTVGRFYFTQPTQPTPTPVVEPRIVYRPQPVVAPMPVASSFPTPKMVHISRGSFTMGSSSGDSDEKPPHTVNIGYDFEIGKYDVSVGEFKRFVNDTGYQTEAEKGDGCFVYANDKWGKKSDANWKNPYFSQGDTQPVVCVSWNDSKAYAKWLSGKIGQSYRLPTEAEWEFVARAGTQSKWSFGDNKSDLKNYGNIADSSTSFSWKESWSDGYKNTAPVGSFRANQKSVNDMHGNVWEWCEDWYLDSYNSTPRDGSANHSQDKNKKVLRGGSWSAKPDNLRSSARINLGASSRNYFVGFRVVVEL